MKVVKNENKNGTVTLKADASPAEVSHAFNSAALAFASQMGVQLDPTKPSLMQIKEKLNVADPEAIVKTQAIEALVPFAVDKSGIIPVAPPKSKSNSDIQNGKPFSFEVRVTPKPEYDLASYDPVDLVIPPYSFPEEQLDAVINRMAEDYAEYVADEPRAIQAGDAVKIALRCKMDGEDLNNLNTDGRTYILGKGMLPEDFDKEILGMEVDETKSFSFALPGAPGQVSMVQCEVTFLEMQKKVVSEVNDEWVAKYMPFYRDAAALRGGVRERMEADFRREYEEAKANMAATEIAKRFKGSIPDHIYESSREVLISNLNAELQQQGLTLDQFIMQNGGEEQFGMTMMLQVRQMLVEGYALDAVYRHEKMQLTDEDINRACMAMDPLDPRGMRRRMEENGYGYSLREVAQRRKASHWLAEHANITIDESLSIM